MAATATVTGSVGPNKSLTAGVFQNIIDVEFDCVDNMLILTTQDGVALPISIQAATVITATKSGSTYTFVVS